MRYASVCDGIGAVHVAWQPLGWECVFTSEIDPFPSAVVEHRWGFENRGDMTKFKEWSDGSPIDLLVGGTPCQSFSVAGLRKGLHDPRGGLMLTFLEIAQRHRPRWVVWENVPGVLSSNGGRDFGAFLGALGELGYGWAYRVLDAQWFGVAQRRRRVFVVGCLGDERRAAQVLFESESVRRDTPPSREPRQGVVGNTQRVAGNGRHGGGWPRDVALSLTAPNTATGRLDPSEQNLVAQPVAFQLNGDRDNPGVSVSDTAFCLPANAMSDRSQAVVQPVAFHPTQDPISSEDGLVHAIGTGSRGGCATAAVAFKPGQSEAAGAFFATEEFCPTLQSQNNGSTAVPAVMHQMAVRRLTPRECERLQGFPDDYTAITYRNKPAADGPRYKALGNSMAVPVMAWIGARLDAVGHRFFDREKTIPGAVAPRRPTC